MDLEGQTVVEVGECDVTAVLTRTDGPGRADCCRGTGTRCDPLYSPGQMDLEGQTVVEVGERDVTPCTHQDRWTWKGRLL